MREIKKMEEKAKSIYHDSNERNGDKIKKAKNLYLEVRYYPVIIKFVVFLKA